MPSRGRYLLVPLLGYQPHLTRHGIGTVMVFFLSLRNGVVLRDPDMSLPHTTQIILELKLFYYTERSFKWNLLLQKCVIIYMENYFYYVIAWQKHNMDELSWLCTLCKSGSGQNAAQCCRPSAASLPLLSLQRTVPRTKLEMGIFANPSGVPDPGPPPKKETVRVELSGCGFLVKYCNVMFDILSLISSVLVWWSDWIYCSDLS